MDSSTLIKNLHKALKEMGHEMPLGHMYEALAKANGHKSWNVVKAKKINFNLGPISTGQYEAKLVCTAGDESTSEIEIKKYVRFHAKDDSDAYFMMCDLVEMSDGGIDENDLTEKSKERFDRLVKEILQGKTIEQFMLEDWEVITNNTMIDVQVILDKDFKDVGL